MPQTGSEDVSTRGRRGRLQGSQGCYVHSGRAFRRKPGGEALESWVKVNSRGLYIIIRGPLRDGVRGSRKSIPENGLEGALVAVLSRKNGI
jgi:hypothetical protein